LVEITLLFPPKNFGSSGVFQNYLGKYSIGIVLLLKCVFKFILSDHQFLIFCFFTIVAAMDRKIITTFDFILMLWFDVLFPQEAHAMVREAKVKQAAAEKRFKEANNKVNKRFQGP